MSAMKTIAVVVAAGLMGGCASTVYQGRLPWSDGWRKGVVIAVGAGATLAKEMSTSCRSAFADLRSDSPLATIKYRRDRRYAWRTVPVPPDAGLKVGDAVYVNAVDCAAPIERRRPDSP
ncbi:MAG: hypothetical protein KJ007_15980 [Burkholderiales bacterium]|nr:hypothetical protein [Burkholderiales bacterium]